MALEAVELSIYTSKTTFCTCSGLSLEHLLPQSRVSDWMAGRLCTIWPGANAAEWAGEVRRRTSASAATAPSCSAGANSGSPPSRGARS